MPPPRAARREGVRCHAPFAPSAVGTERLQESGCFRAQQAQEKLIRGSGVPFSIAHATQFFEFMQGIADSATKDDNTVHLALIAIQSVYSDDAAAVGRTAVGEPVGGVVEVSGPDTFQLDELIRKGLAAKTTRARSYPIPRPSTSAPSWRKRRCCPARTRASAKRDSPTGSRGRRSRTGGRRGLGIRSARRPVPGHLSGTGRCCVPIQVGRVCVLPDMQRGPPTKDRHGRSWIGTYRLVRPDP